MLLEEKLRKSFVEKEELQRRKSLKRYKLNQKYKYQYPYATPFIVACEKGNIDDINVPFAGGIKGYQRLGLRCHPNKYSWDVCYRPLSNRDVNPQGNRIHEKTK
jgi:hypothetical protein